ncbi:MFS transporter [Thiohalorhabdus sp. Cl-TMA]|uniref:MFS transporter n=1 Tax=Thiohalorhabdus methylotrophus TaxID=3242694 RepID=A0ABV4TVF9_9GAMM
MPSPNERPPRTAWAGRGEILAWAFYDFANSGYTTVVITAVFNAYFVGAVAGGGPGAWLLWTVALSLSHAVVLLIGPWVGQTADETGRLKPWLGASTALCIAGTAALGLVGPGELALGMALILVSNTAFGLGENLIAAFLPRLVPPERLGRTSAFGWTIGYIGGLLTLLVCLAYVRWSQAQGGDAADFIPVTMLIVAGLFALTALPTFLWVRERPGPLARGGYRTNPWRRTLQAWRDARQLPDLARFLVCLAIFYCGIQTVVALAAIYAEQVMGFSKDQTITLILVVNLAAAAGAWLLGRVHDRIGAVRTVAVTLVGWLVAILLAYFARGEGMFWVAAFLVGACMGSSQSSGRALVAMLSPAGHEGAFFGLWGVAVKVAAIVGPLSYGLLSYFSAGNYRGALLATAGFFVVGLVLLVGVDERRGRERRMRFTPGLDGPA